MSGVWSRAAEEADLTVMLPGDVPMFFRRIIEPGQVMEFRMGWRGGGRCEEPRHCVRLTVPSYLATFVATQVQYRMMAKQAGGGPDADPSHFRGDRRPVEQVSWDEAMRVCEWLSKSGLLDQAGLGRGWVATLPTEAQWEYACGAGRETEYYNGDGEAVLADIGWYAGNSGYETHPVDEEVVKGRSENHPFGLQGMHGNVWEWCLDDWDDAPYRGRVDGVFDPVIRGSGQMNRVLRGGSWNSPASVRRSAIRSASGTGNRSRDVGFRVCLVLDTVPGKQPESQGRSGAGRRGRSRGRLTERVSRGVRRDELRSIG